MQTTLSVRDAADFAHDRGAGVESILTQIEGEDPAARTMSDGDRKLAEALLEFFRKVIKHGNAALTARRFVALALQLAPDVLGLSQNAASKQLGCTRAAMSKITIKLSEEMRLGHARWRKSEGSRNVYREAQLAAVQRGTHARFKRLEKKLKKTATKKQVG